MPAREQSGRFVRIATAGAFFQGGAAAVDTGTIMASLVHGLTGSSVAVGATAAIARYGRFVREYFGIGDDRQLVCGISFGYADREHPINAYRTSRAELGEAVRWESE